VFRNFEAALAADVDLSLDNPMFSEIDNPGLGRFLVPGSPLNFAGHERAEPVPAPLLGTHTEEILGDVVGLPDVEIASLFDDGVVESPSFKAAQPAF
jgi:2-methylfumaryl-CoA isomerase